MVGQTLYIPSTWSYAIKNKEGISYKLFIKVCPRNIALIIPIIKSHIIFSYFLASIIVWEHKLTEPSVESFVAKIRTEQDQTMLNTLIKMLEKRESETKARLLLKRLSEASKQLRSPHKKIKN